jgi:hypothetical protein
MPVQHPDRYLGIYVRDHHAAATANIALARRFAAANRGTAFGDAVASVTAHFEADRQALEQVAHALGVRLSATKDLAARAGELLGRLKLNGRLRGYSPLSRLLELEVLIASIDAKRNLWRSLSQARRLELEAFDLDALVRDATWQRTQLAPHHERAAEEAFDELWPARLGEPVPA